MQFVTIIRQGDKSRTGLIEQTFATMIHKFSQNLEIWKTYLGYLVEQTRRAEKQAAVKEATTYRKTFEDMLAQALSVVPAKGHVALLSALACKQYKNENVQAGRNMFDAILDKYPKLTDQWHVYIDMEAGYGEVAKVRELFERATALHHSSKSMQSLLKKCIFFFFFFFLSLTPPTLPPFCLSLPFFLSFDE
jgi:rRNA biogenesis protein RRP5